MPALESMIIVALTFLVAGSVKGVTGLGLPSVSLALLTATLGLKAAMAILLVPSLVTNIWQAAVGGYLAVILRRIWTLLVAICVATWFGVAILAKANADLLAGLLGLVLCIYAACGLARVDPAPPGRSEPWLSPLVGAVSGMLNGMTGSFVVPGVLYLQSLGFPRDGFIQSLGVLFTTSTIALGFALQSRQLLSGELAVLSAWAVVPALIGMVAGQAVRQRLSERTFRNVFFAALLVLGAYITLRALRMFM
jgi:uncharacterized membrane protein YfcA